jgi:hypothetical protein
LFAHTQHSQQFCLTLVHLGIAQHTFHWVHALPEHVHAQLLKPSASDGGVEVNALKQGVNLKAGLRGGGQRALGALARRAQAAQGASAAAEVLAVLALELLQG